MCQLSWNLGASTSWNPHGLSRHVMGLLYLLPFNTPHRIKTSCICLPCYLRHVSACTRSSSGIPYTTTGIPTSSISHSSRPIWVVRRQRRYDSSRRLQPHTLKPPDLKPLHPRRENPKLLSRNTNKMQLCNRIYYSKVYWRLNINNYKKLYTVLFC